MDTIHFMNIPSWPALRPFFHEQSAAPPRIPLTAHEIRGSPPQVSNSAKSLCALLTLEAICVSKGCVAAAATVHKTSDQFVSLWRSLRSFRGLSLPARRQQQYCKFKRCFCGELSTVHPSLRRSVTERFLGDACKIPCTLVTEEHDDDMN